MINYEEIYSELSKHKSKVSQSLIELDKLDVACKSVLTRYLQDGVPYNSSTMTKIQAVIDYMYEQVNIGNWKEVQLFIRKTITTASYLRLLMHIKCKENINDDIILKEAFKIIDFGILFGCPLDAIPTLLQDCAQIFNMNFKHTSGEHNLMPEEIDIAVCSSANENQFNAVPLEILDCPSMEYFYTNYILAQKPVVLKNCINHWPALSKWKNQEYFITLAGHRTVAIELGSKYTDAEWTQKLMTISEFIKSHIYQSDGPTGYLAQYQLFEQIPELKNDISEPDYCCFSESHYPVDVMAWYGPKGTVSPLHHDPKRNLLAQVVGEKQIFLFSPKDSEHLYPHEHQLLNNTARIDPRNPDLNQYPKYKDATALYCKLQPGQLLYIPPKWWHFVESLSISFSVSFWWE